MQILEEITASERLIITPEESLIEIPEQIAAEAPSTSLQISQEIDTAPEEQLQQKAKEKAKESKQAPPKIAQALKKRSLSIWVIVVMVVLLVILLFIYLNRKKEDGIKF